MHQTRSEVSKKIPIPRKGTKYVALAKIDPQNSVPVVIAIRDMLKLARTLKEVEKMIQQRLLKINGRIVKDYRESIQLFNILEAGKHYKLTLNEQGKFVFAEDSSSERLCKITGKHLLPKSRIQFNLHEGSNLVTKEKFVIGDTLYLDFSGKVKKHVSLEKNKKCFVISGKYSGSKGSISHVEGSKIKVDFENNSAVLDKRSVVVL